MQKSKLLSVLFIFLYVTTSDALAFGENKVEKQNSVIQELVNLLTTDKELIEKFNRGFLAQPVTSDWNGKQVADLYSFFAKWLVFSPRLEKSKQYIDEFKSFYVIPSQQGSRQTKYIKEAREAVLDPKFSNWLKRFVKARGTFLNSQLSKHIVLDWVSEKAVAVGQYQIPSTGFQSFNQFFTRNIKNGVRPIFEKNDALSLVSPADCLLWKDSGWMSTDESTIVKGSRYNLEALFDDQAVSRKYVGGDGMVCFLEADNYHRFHAPTTGKISYVKEMDGRYFGLKGFVDTFHERRRSLIEIKMENGKHIAISAIGIATISSVSLSVKEGDMVAKGDELGKFEFGGSALVLLFEPGMIKSFVPDAAEAHYSVRFTKFQMGQYLGELSK